MVNKFVFCFFLLSLLFNISLCQTCQSDVCFEELVEPGRCKAAIRRWGYDQDLGICRQFTWGGCDGNGNMFGSQMDCQSDCEITTTDE